MRESCRQAIEDRVLAGKKPATVNR